MMNVVLKMMSFIKIRLMLDDNGTPCDPEAAGEFESNNGVFPLENDDSSTENDDSSNENDDSSTENDDL